MKVIKDNSKPWSYKMTCPTKGCGCVFEADAADVQDTEAGSYGETGHLAHCVACPKCRSRYIVPEAKLGPAFWRDRRSLGK